MKSLTYLSAFTALGMSAAVYACSANDSADLGFPQSSGGSGAGSTTSTGSTNTGSTTGIFTNTNRGGSTGIVTTTTATVDADAGCGAGDQPAELTPVYMVFMYDKSGSMGDDPKGQWQNLATRWTPMKQGMIDFFSNSGTIGIQASLEFFPANGDKVTTCHADYKTPAVAMTSLETPQSLIDALDRTVPGGGTPTLPAVMGGLAYAKQLMAAKPGSKAVLVLVTDGEPAIYVVDPATGQGVIETDCAPTTNPSNLTNTIADIVTVVNAAKQDANYPVPTYVIGIGEAQDDMSAIASAGGTRYIQLDATQPPETTRAKLTETLKSIRTTQFVCNMPIPDSATFRKDMVNVSFKHTSGAVESLGKSVSCTVPGWYFDNEQNPTKIELCPATCSAIQQDLTGKLQIVLGCPTIIL